MRLQQVNKSLWNELFGVLKTIFDKRRNKGNECAANCVAADCAL